MTHLLDRSGRRYPANDARWRGDDGSPLMMTPLRAPAPDEIVGSDRSLWRYRAALPVAPEHAVSLGEGMTPMLTQDWGGHRVHVKLEWFNPTSSFKDRGVSVMISHLRSLGVPAVLEHSSGNGGSSVAAYAAAAGMRARIVVPAATSPAKILQARAFGAQLQPVEGSRDDVADEAVRQSASTCYASHNWQPYFLQGIKTIAYEMWEALGFTAPDNVVVVAGAGSLVLGCDIAFSELLDAGLISRRPRLLVGQPEHWATIADTVNGVDPTTRGPRVPTVAEGASIARPVRLPEVVDAIRRSAGAAVAVTEDEITSAVRALAARGLYAEPSSAVAAAAFHRFAADGTIGPDQTTVVVLTGTGLKAIDAMARVLDAPEPA
ncbi:pyridoxal-phosphate dependent enzyme [Pseudonocardia sp. CA-107938]|uniref:pyridoxal-phosphate dependent enzyme n=1 Tax=Pseudonocardia sp. CA-107938 TaxID=3240021 RepID=UPI003D8C41CA